MANKKQQVTPTFGPETDGIDHINILAGKAKTVIGKRLSHFAESPFIHPYYGSFQSMEAYWHYIKTGFRREELRGLVGFTAKQTAARYNTRWYYEFCEDILAGDYQKIIQDEALAHMVVESELPFTHYYLFGEEPNQRVVYPRESLWLIPGLEDIRTALKKGEVPQCWKSAALRYARNVASGNPPQGKWDAEYYARGEAAKAEREASRKKPEGEDAQENQDE